MKSLLAAILILVYSEPSIAQSWQAIAPMKFARAESEAVQLHDGTILVVGGYADGVVEGTCEIYSPNTDTWRLTGSLSQPRFRFALNILPSGKVVALGGLTNLGDGTTSSCEVYDPTTGTWTTFGNLPEPSENFPTCYLDDSTLVFLGGLDANTISYLATSGEINPNTLAMSAIPPMLIGTYSHFGEYLSSRRMIVVGGGDLGGTGGPYLRSTEVFDLSTRQWTFVDSLITVCADGNHHIVKLNDDRLVIPSGRSGPNTETLAVQIFDPVTLTWSAPGNLQRPHFHCYSILAGVDSILTIGGATDPASTQDIVNYTDWYNCRDSTSWEGPSMIDPRHVYSALNLLLPVPAMPCVDSEAIYVFGGETTGKVDINRCERLVLGVLQTGVGGPTALILPPRTQSILQSSCTPKDTAIYLGVTGCGAAGAMLDSVWVSEASAIKLNDSRTLPRSIGASDSILIQYAPGATGRDTSRLNIRYNLGAGILDTSIIIIGTSTMGPAKLTLAAVTQQLVAATCQAQDSSIRLGIVGCLPGNALLDSAWIAGSSAIKISDTRSEPRLLGVSDSITVQYSPSASRKDTAQLNIRYNLGSGILDTSITIIGAIGSALLSAPVSLHREVAVSYFGSADTLPLGVDISSSVNLDSIWPYLHDISATYSFDSSVVTYFAYLPPNGWTANTISNRGDAVDFAIHNVSSVSPGSPVSLGTGVFLPSHPQLQTSDVSLTHLVMGIGNQSISPCVSEDEDQHWSVKVLVTDGVNTAQSQTNSLSIYPNPVGDELFVQNPNADAVPITLYDAIGRAVLLANASGGMTTGIDVSSLPPSAYMAVCHERGGTVVRRIIKN